MEREALFLSCFILTCHSIAVLAVLLLPCAVSSLHSAMMLHLCYWAGSSSQAGELVEQQPNLQPCASAGVHLCPSHTGSSPVSHVPALLWPWLTCRPRVRRESRIPSGASAPSPSWMPGSSRKGKSRSGGERTARSPSGGFTWRRGSKRSEYGAYESQIR